MEIYSTQPKPVHFITTHKLTFHISQIKKGKQFHLQTQSRHLRRPSGTLPDFHDGGEEPGKDWEVQWMHGVICQSPHHQRSGSTDAGGGSGIAAFPLLKAVEYCYC